MRKSAVALVIACVAIAAPVSAFADTAAPVTGHPLAFSADKIAKIKIQITLHENRAKELQPLLARATQEHTDMEADATTLENNAKDLRAQGTAFKTIASESDSAKVKQEFNTFAREVDQMANNNDEQAKTLHESARKLEAVVKFEQRAIQFHLDMAAKLKASLAANS